MDRARSRERGQPLCMEQYYRLFTSYRYPGIERDSLVTSYPSGDEPEHIIVACKNQVLIILSSSVCIVRRSANVNTMNYQCNIVSPINGLSEAEWPVLVCYVVLKINK